MLGRRYPASLLCRARHYAFRLPGSNHRNLLGPAGATHGRREPPRGSRRGSTWFYSMPSGSGLRSSTGRCHRGSILEEWLRDPLPLGIWAWALEELAGQEKKLMREREGSGWLGKPSDKVAWVPPMCWFAAGQREVAIASRRSHGRLQTQHCACVPRIDTCVRVSAKPEAENAVQRVSKSRSFESQPHNAT
jgi:hypothetical protein